MTRLYKYVILTNMLTVTAVQTAKPNGNFKFHSNHHILLLLPLQTLVSYQKNGNLFMFINQKRATIFPFELNWTFPFLSLVLCFLLFAGGGVLDNRSTFSPFNIHLSPTMITCFKEHSISFKK